MASNLLSPTIADRAIADRAPAEPRRLLGRLDAWPFLRIERRGMRAVLYGGDRDQVIGTMDVRTGVLMVDVRPDAVGRLLGCHPQLQGVAGGVRLDVTDAGRGALAEGLLRWRLGLERFAPQLREASP
jgi:hypothetical protein